MEERPMTHGTVMKILNDILFKYKLTDEEMEALNKVIRFINLSDPYCLM